MADREELLAWGRGKSADREELLRLADTIEAEVPRLARHALGGGGLSWMRQAADYATVAASLRARAQDPLREHGGGE